MCADQSSVIRNVSAGVPSGQVVFVFTDVEGSTKLWVGHRERMGDSLRLHDEVVRASIEAQGGHVLAAAGDSFGAVFATVSVAISAAPAIQEALGRAEWPGPELRVRIGLHQDAGRSAAVATSAPR